MAWGGIFLASLAGLGFFFVGYPGLTSGGLLCRRFAAGMVRKFDRSRIGKSKAPPCRTKRDKDGAPFLVIHRLGCDI